MRRIDQKWARLRVAGLLLGGLLWAPSCGPISDFPSLSSGDHGMGGIFVDAGTQVPGSETDDGDAATDAQVCVASPDAGSDAGVIDDAAAGDAEPEDAGSDADATSACPL